MKFTKQVGFQLEPKEYVFLGCNEGYMVAVSKDELCFYKKETMDLERKLATGEHVTSADLYSNMLILVFPSKVVFLNTENFELVCFDVPRIKKVFLTEKYLILHSQDVALLFERCHDNYEFKEKIEDVEDVTKSLLVLKSYTRCLFPLDDTYQTPGDGCKLSRDFIDAVEAQNSVLVTESYLKVRDREVKHSMHKEVLYASFGIFTMFVKQRDTLFYLLQKDELELDEELNMASCRQQDGVPMGVLFLFSFKNMLYFLDEGYYINIFCIEGVDLDYKLEKRLLFPMFNITHTNLVTKSHGSFLSIFPSGLQQEKELKHTGSEQVDKDKDQGEEKAIGVQQGLFDKVPQELSCGSGDRENTTNMFLEAEKEVNSRTESINAKQKDPFKDFTEDLDAVISRIQEIRVRNRHIKIFRYYESKDLYTTNLDLYRKLRKAECMIEDIKNGTFTQKLCGDIDVLSHKIKETQRVNEAMVRSSVLYIDSRILGKGTFSKKPVHYKQPLPPRNAYSRNYKDTPPLQRMEYARGCLVEISDTKDVGGHDNENAIDLTNLNIGKPVSGTEKKEEAASAPFLEMAYSSEKMHAPSIKPVASQETQTSMLHDKHAAEKETSKGTDVAKPNVGSTKPSVEPDQGGNTSSLLSIFKPQEPSQSSGQGLFNTAGLNFFNQQGNPFANIQATSNLFSQAAQNNLFQTPGKQQSAELHSENVQKDNKSALSKFSSQMGSFFGKTE